MSVLIVGANGSMGKRYQAILSRLDIEHVPMDIQHRASDLEYQGLKSSGVIIASPTESHCDYIKFFSRFKIPILCEKPISKSKEDFDEIVDFVKREKVNLTMTFQYKALDHHTSTGLSYYDYFRHGNDGLAWDCIQIIGLARANYFLSEQSPVWRCHLNGRALSLSDMDLAYVKFVKDWLREPGEDLEFLKDVHYRTAEEAQSWR